MRGGFLGVDLFFVVSGYLITRQLLERRTSERRRGDELRWFWSRRARRLLPSLVVCIVVTLTWTARVGSPMLFERTWGQAVAGLFFASNWWELHAGSGYWAVAADRTPLNHLWSLAVEEQFYLVWPITFVAVGWRGGGRRSLLTIAVVAACASFTLQWALGGSGAVTRGYLGTDTRLGAILLGAAVALWGDLRPQWRSVDASPAFSALGGAALALLLVSWVTLQVDPALFRGQLAACSLAAATVVLGVVRSPAGLLTRLLEVPSLVDIGRLSYVLYLWHVPVVVLLTEDRTGLGYGQVLGARLVTLVVLVGCTRAMVERPIHRYGWSRNTIGQAATGGLLLIVITGALLPLIDRGPTPTAPPTSSPDSTVTPIAPPIERSFTRAEVEALRVLVVGDSWGMRTQYGMRHMAAPRPSLVVSAAMPSCGLADPFRAVAGDGTTFTPEPRCIDWRTGWQGYLDGQPPDVAILQVGNWDQAPQQFTEDGPYLAPCDAGYAERYHRHLDEALEILVGEGRHVFVATVRDNDGAPRAKSDCMNQLLVAGIERDRTGRVHLLDLRHHLCPDGRCLTEVDGRPLYDDTAHIAVDQLPSVNAWIFAQMGNVLGSQVPPVDHWR